MKERKILVIFSCIEIEKMENRDDSENYKYSNQINIQQPLYNFSYL